MKFSYLYRAFIAFIVVLSMAWSTVASAEDEVSESVHSEETEKVSNVAESVDSEVAASIDDEAANRRSEIIQEAVDALAETKTALAALDENRIDDALDALAMVTGKLQIIVAREPSLAFAPTDVSFVTQDIFTDMHNIESAVEEAKNALNDGDVQIARSILKTLGSEIVVRVSNLPLATYPDAIAAIVPLIDNGEIEAAKSALQSALNTQIVREYVVPLPITRASYFLSLAEDLAENQDRTDEQNADLESHMDSARHHLEMAEVLGYGNRELFPELFAQLDTIDSKIADGKSGIGFFDLIKKSIADS